MVKNIKRIQKGQKNQPKSPPKPTRWDHKATWPNKMPDSCTTSAPRGLAQLPRLPRAQQRNFRAPSNAQGRVLSQQACASGSPSSSLRQVGPHRSTSANRSAIKCVTMGPHAALLACHSTTRGYVGPNVPLLGQSRKSLPNSRAPRVYSCRCRQSSCDTWKLEVKFSQRGNQA